MMTTSKQPKTREEWQVSLGNLPVVSPPGKIPAFYFGHGQPMLIWPDSVPAPSRDLFAYLGPNGPLANFLKDFGPALLHKYNPKAIIVFSAHWESNPQCLVTDYGAENPLLMDYFGFDSELYKVQFKSRGDGALAKRVVSLLEKRGISARTTTTAEPRGRDGRGFYGPGLDHGVFIPFKLMFGDTIDIPIIQVSIDQSLDPEKNWKLGKALEELRSEDILVLAGGLTIHTFEDFSAFSEPTAKPIFKGFDQAVIDAVQVSTPEARRKALMELTSHPGFRKAHPREEHFIPLYIAAGAGEAGEVRVISGIYGAPTFAFGL